MAEYIKREAVIDLITRRYENPEICTQEINSIPVADVAPVVHGRWAHLGGDEWCCSVCGFVITTEGSWDKPAKKYCEDCGAKMDGERKEEANES